MEEPTHYTPPDFIIETVTDPEGVNATISTMLPSVRFHMNLVLGILLLIIGPSLLVLREYLIGAVALIMGIYCMIFYWKFPARVANKQCARFRECYGTDRVPCQLVFWPQGVVINNRCSGGSARVRYEIIRNITRCGDYLTFRTEENQSVILRMRDIEDKPGFLPYFLGKCPNAKQKGL